MWLWEGGQLNAEVDSSRRQAKRTWRRPSSLKNQHHHKPEITGKDFAKIAGGIVLSFMKVEKGDYFWIVEVFRKQFAKGLSEIYVTIWNLTI